MTLDLSRLVVWQYRDLIIQGATVTIQITAISMAISVVIALVVVFLRISTVPPARWLGTAYIEVGRDTPILVLIMWSTYVLPPLLGVGIDVFWTATLALVLQTSGYLAETFRSGIESVDKGQYQAAEALGMHYSLMMRRVILPQALRRSVPDVLNNVVVLFKTTTLVSVVAVPDLWYQATNLTAEFFKPVETYTSVGLLYLLAVFVLAVGVRRVQRRYQMRERAESR